MKNYELLSIWILLKCAVWVLSDGVAECEDKSNYCHKIGTKFPLSKCYQRHDRCCATCSRLQLPIQGCPYGDSTNECSDLGQGDKPISECYTYPTNTTCCETCHQYKSDNPNCPFGDSLQWCSGIGTRFSVASCYEKEDQCCDACARFKQHIPGCEYGDHEIWCSLIDKTFCDTNPHACCATCAKLATATTTSTTTTTTTPPTMPTIPMSLSEILPTISRSSPKQDGTTTSPPENHHIAEITTTYTGSPGRPSVHSTIPAHPTTNSVIHSSPVYSRTPSQKQNSSEQVSDSDIKYNTTVPCDTLYNTTGHRIRHHHRISGRHHRLMCVNVSSTFNNTVNLTTTPVPHRTSSEPLWLIISKGMRPQSSTVTVPLASTSQTLSLKDLVTQAQKIAQNSSLSVRETTTINSGIPGEMDYQGDYSSFSSTVKQHYSLLLVFTIIGIFCGI